MAKNRTCPLCNEERALTWVHPDNKAKVCRRCWTKASGKFGRCPVCRKGPRELANKDPRSGSNICQTCSAKIRGVKRKRNKGICPYCPPGSAAKQITYWDPEGKVHICGQCFARIRHRPRKRRQGYCSCSPEKIQRVNFRRCFGRTMCDACFKRTTYKPKPKMPRVCCRLCRRKNSNAQYKLPWLNFPVCRKCRRDFYPEKKHFGNCFTCGGWKNLPAKHWVYDKRICMKCYKDHLEQSKRKVA